MSDPAGLYLRLRAKEGRLFSDEMAARLPDVPAGHPLQAEWRQRSASSARLAAYLQAPQRPLTILELGCGCGWLAHRLSQAPSAHVWGLDRLGSELAQAGRVFHRPNLTFLAGDIFNPPFPPASFDRIVVASVIQYFPDLPHLLGALQTLLRPAGEIHLLDSPLYRPADIPAARRCTHSYYQSIGFPEMAAHYFHHAITDLAAFAPRWLYRPDSLLARLQRLTGQSVSPFPWLVITRR